MIVREQITTTQGSVANLLLHCNGADASTSFPDSGGNNKTVTVNGNAQIDTAQSKFGGASALFDGTGDYLNLDGSADFAFGTGDFTIDFWVRFNAIVDPHLIEIVAGTHLIYINANNFVFFSSGSTAIIGTTTLTTGVWYHFALTRASGSTRLFVNGSQEGATFTDTTNYSVGASTYPRIGSDGGGKDLNGWMDEIRIIKGTAAWTSNFTAPAAPYSDPIITTAAFTDSGLPIIGSDNIVTLGNVEATTEDVDFPASNLGNPSTHLKWQEPVTSPQSTADVYITVSVPLDTTVSPAVQRTIDYLAIAKHNFGSAGCTVSVEATTDATSPIGGYTTLASILPTNDDPIIFQFEPRQPTYVRLKITDGSALRQLAVLYVGELLTLERGVKVEATHTPINLGRLTNVINGFSESGNFVGRIVRNNVNESKAEFMHFTPTWYRANFDPFILEARTHPFFWAWDPADYPTDVGFAWLVKDAIPEFNPIVLRFNITLEMRGIA